MSLVIFQRMSFEDSSTPRSGCVTGYTVTGMTVAAMRHFVCFPFFTMKLFRKKKPVEFDAEFTREDVRVGVIRSACEQYCLHIEKYDDLEWYAIAHIEKVDVPKVKDLFDEVERYVSAN